MMDTSLSALVDELAALAVDDYLRETAANDADSDAARSNHPLATPREAA